MDQLLNNSPSDQVLGAPLGLGFSAILLAVQYSKCISQINVEAVSCNSPFSSLTNIPESHIHTRQCVWQRVERVNRHKRNDETGRKQWQSAMLSNNIESQHELV